MTKHPSRNPLYDTGRYKPADEESQKWHRQFPFTLRKGVTGWRGPSKLTAGKASFDSVVYPKKAQLTGVAYRTGGYPQMVISACLDPKDTSKSDCHIFLDAVRPSTQIQIFVTGLGEFHSDINRFKLALRDFLIQLKEFSSGDNAELYLEEREDEAQRKAETEREFAMHIPGMLKPSQLEDEDKDIS
ncbi:hypothetical protein BKA82DRAFT_4336216, partial [Pisolithus tinctorius]